MQTVWNQAWMCSWQKKLIMADVALYGLGSMGATYADARMGHLNQYVFTRSEVRSVQNTEILVVRSQSLQMVHGALLRPISRC
jgi:hypothetical protein